MADMNLILDLINDAIAKARLGQRGDKGDTGPQGAKGDKGEKGDRGDRGPQGDRGNRGEKGEAGARGPEGPQGPKGRDGIDGINAPHIDEIVRQVKDKIKKRVVYVGTGGDDLYNPTKRKYKTVDDNYTASNSEFFIEITTAGKTITLPDATVRKSREFNIYNSSGGLCYVANHKYGTINLYDEETIGVVSTGTVWRTT